MRVVRCVALLACFLALAGCGTFGRKNAGNGPAARAPDPPPRTDTPAPASRPLEPAGGTSGLLAGQIVESHSRQPPPVFIQVSMVRQGAEPAGAPIEVAADAHGYFTIQGLQPGRPYQLIARAQDGERKLAGTVWATPPNPRVVIRISEDFVTPQTPDVPAPPVYPGTKPPAPAWPDKTAAPPAAADQAWGPTHSAPAADPDRVKPGAAGLGAPFKVEEPENGKAETPAPSPERTAAGPDNPDRRRSPTLNIGGPRPQPPRETPLPAAPPPVPSSPPATAAPPTTPAPVPSCVLTGQKLVNFALHDLNGRPWEYRQHRRGRLVLLDFWGSWCTHCFHAVPHLNILQEKYGLYGLEVVGIAYEEGTFIEQVQKVNRVRQRLNINYTLLLGGDKQSCPVKTQFNVRAFPTLVLVDETGRIIWRSQGFNQQQLAELEMLIRQQLAVR